MKRAILRSNNSFTATAWINEESDHGVTNSVDQIDIKVKGYWYDPISIRTKDKRLYPGSSTSISYGSGGYDRSIEKDAERIRHFARALEWSSSIARLLDDGALVGGSRFDISVERWLDNV